MKTIRARYITPAELETLKGQPATGTDNLGIPAVLPDGKLVLIEVDQETFAEAVAQAKAQLATA